MFNYSKKMIRNCIPTQRYLYNVHCISKTYSFSSNIFSESDDQSTITPNIPPSYSSISLGGFMGALANAYNKNPHSNVKVISLTADPDEAARLQRINEDIFRPLGDETNGPSKRRGRLPTLRSEEIIKIWEEMKRLGEWPLPLIHVDPKVSQESSSASNQDAIRLAYNYLISARLERGERLEAFHLLEEMEMERGTKPDVFTFELFLMEIAIHGDDVIFDNGSLSIVKRELDDDKNDDDDVSSSDAVMISTPLGKAILLEELWDLMKRKYNLVPNSSCWIARFTVWFKTKHYARLNTLLKELLLGESDNSTRISSFPISREVGPKWDRRVYANILRMAAFHGRWNLIEQLIPLIIPENHHQQIGQLDPEKGHLPKIRLIEEDYVNCWYARADKLTLSCVPFLRFIHSNLQKFSPRNEVDNFLSQSPSQARMHSSLISTSTILDEGSYVRLLYFASRHGRSLADLAYYALHNLMILYGRSLFTRKMVHHPNNWEENCDNISSFEKNDCLREQLSLPRHYLEAFLECIQGKRHYKLEPSTDNSNDINESIWNNNNNNYVICTLWMPSEEMLMRLKERINASLISSNSDNYQ